MSRPFALPTLPLLAAAGPAWAVVPDSGGISGAPVPEAPSAPPTVPAVIELLKKGNHAEALKGAREFVKSSRARRTPAGPTIVFDGAWSV